MGRALVRTKIIDHKRYKLMLKGVSKFSAMETAIYVKHHGGMARIVESGGGGHDLWVRDTTR
jgi:hypothetical protein